MEVYTSGTLDAWLTPAAAPRERWRACMDRLSADGARAYRGYVHENPSFLEYFRTATPLPELEHVNIGSRPARRKAAAGIAALRPSRGSSRGRRRASFSAPGSAPGTRWSGRRSAASSTSCAGCIASGRTSRSVMDLTAMVLAKTDARIAAEYERRLVPDALRPLGADLRGRLARAIRATLDVTGHQQLLAENQVLQRSIDVATRTSIPSTSCRSRCCGGSGRETPTSGFATRSS